MNARDDHRPRAVEVALDLGEIGVLISAALDMAANIVANHDRLAGEEYAAECVVRGMPLSATHKLISSGLLGLMIYAAAVIAAAVAASRWWSC
jgi:hypothetical protein